MRIANIEIFKNKCGTATIYNEDSLNNDCVSFPIEMIPTIIDCLNTLYQENNGKSDIQEDEDE